MKVNLQHAATSLGIFLVVMFLGSCSSSVTNVWDYYVKNNVEKHTPGQSSASKSKMLYRHQESLNKAQLELIAFKTDSAKFLVLGSHKIAKAFIMHDSLYHFDVNDLYSNVRGNDFIRQLGDLSIFFTHIPSADCELLLNNFEALRKKYNQLSPADGSIAYMDYTITREVFISMEKTSQNQQLNEVNFWIGKRKHKIDANDLVKALQDLKAFN